MEKIEQKWPRKEHKVESHVQPDPCHKEYKKTGYVAANTGDRHDLTDQSKDWRRSPELPMLPLQNELEGLHEKLGENEDVQEALESTSAELSAAQKEQLSGLEHQLKLQNSAMGSLLSSTEDDLLLKASELEGIELQLEEEVYARASAEDALQISSTALLKENYSDLEKKLNISDEKFGKANSLLAESLRNHRELVERLKSQLKLHEVSETVAASSSNRILFKRIRRSGDQRIPRE